MEDLKDKGGDGRRMATAVWLLLAAGNGLYLCSVWLHLHGLLFENFSHDLFSITFAVLPHSFIMFQYFDHAIASESLIQNMNPFSTRRDWSLIIPSPISVSPVAD